MSTKSSLVHGDDFYLYSEAFEEDAVYLSISKTDFEVISGEVTIRIPLSIWEVIREKTIADFSLIDKSDDEIVIDVTAHVKKRIADFLNVSEARRSIRHLFGLMQYGPVDAPEAEQIARGVDYEKNRRENQRALLQEIIRLKAS